jgi:signal transduction histidine kinase
MPDPNSPPTGLQDKELDARPFELMGAMLTGFLHVMRNKVNNASASLALLEHPNLPAEEREHVFATLKLDLNRMEQVCDDLVNFSSFQHSSADRVYVNHLFQTVWSDMPERLKSNISVQLRLDPNGPSVFGNKTQLQVALRMLIQNALEAMPHGGSLVYSTEEKHGIVRIRLADTGGGMDKLTRERCFEPFYTTKARGTGLGLPVAATIAKRHDGLLRITSRVGKGTIWTMSFKRVGYHG